MDDSDAAKGEALSVLPIWVICGWFFGEATDRAPKHTTHPQITQITQTGIILVTLNAEP
jgi:hypothetical protein